jgi:hypothetical protein
MPTETLQHLLSELGAICKHHNEISRVTGANFNIFRILKVSEDEVKHSAFLTELLNPKGSHGQGDVFLKLFVEKLGIKDFHCESAIAEVEKHVGKVTDATGGRIDILVDDKRGNHIIIENKIYAGDQDNQLIRYHNFSHQNLFYLTLHGGDASEKSITNTEFEKKLVKGEDYKLISYKTDILDWLELCQKEAVSMPLVREGIAHYINLIKHLTGQSINKAMNKEIVDLLTKNPTNMANANELLKNWSYAKAIIQWKFWVALKNALLTEFKSENLELKENDKTADWDKVWTYYNGRAKLLGLWCQIYKKDEITLHWGCEINQRFYSGFTVENNGEGIISNQEEYKKYRDIILECDNLYKIDNPGWLGWQFSSPELNFNEFISEAIFNLADDKYLEETVQIIVKKAIENIRFVKEKLNNLYF